MSSMNRPPIVIIGLGEMGAAFAHGWLRCGHPITPVNRGDDPSRLAVDPLFVLVAVPEGALDGVLEGLPEAWRDRVGLLQNELLPTDWERHGIEDPTVTSVWFEKKRTKPLHVVLPSVAAGPHAELVLSAITALAIPGRIVPREQLLLELVAKNLYILTANIAGMVTGGTVGELWAAHRGLATDVAREVLAIQAWRAGVDALPEERLIEGLVRAFEADPEHGCTGRSAPTRLERALGHAKDAGVEVPTLSRIAERCSSGV